LRFGCYLRPSLSSDSRAGLHRDLCDRNFHSNLSGFRTVRALINLASLIYESHPLGFDLINGSHQQYFGEGEVAERVVRDLEHNRRYRDYAQDAAGRMPLCVFAKCFTLLRGNHLCDICCDRLGSMPECGHTAKAIPAFIPLMESDLRWFFFGACLAFPTKSGVSRKCRDVTTSIGQARLCAWIQEILSVTSDIGCHGSISSGDGPRAGECVERRG